MAPHTTKLIPPHRFVRRPFWSRGRAGPVLLTFDDGPHPTHTADVLDRLERYDVRGVFFLLGNRIVACPDLVHRIRQGGHRIGNHTYSHPWPTWFGFRTAHRELARCQQSVTEAAGEPPVLFRPPMGRWTLPLRIAAMRHRLIPLGWSLDSGDWRVRGDADADQCGDELLTAVRSGDVILLHDYHPWIGRILDQVLPALAVRGLLAG